MHAQPLNLKKSFFEKYGVLLKESRGRFSYLHPDRSKSITDRSLGSLYKTDSILKQIAENAEVPDSVKSQEQQNACPAESEPFKQDNPVYETVRPDAAKKPEHSMDISRDCADISEYGAERNKKTPDTPGYADRNTGNRTDAFKNISGHDKKQIPSYDSVSILYFQSELRLVTDLQNCIRAQQNQSYAQKVKKERRIITGISI